MTRYSKEEKLTHLELWSESGLSKLAYCKEADLHYKTFLSWTEVGDVYNKKSKKSPPKTMESEIGSPHSFIPLDISSSNMDSPTPSFIEITYPNGVRLSCPSTMELSVLKSLLKL